MIANPPIVIAADTCLYRSGNSGMSHQEGVHHSVGGGPIIFRRATSQLNRKKIISTVIYRGVRVSYATHFVHSPPPPVSDKGNDIC